MLNKCILLHGGTFYYKGSVLNQQLFDKLEILAKYIDIPKPVNVLGPGGLMQRCMHYKNWILINDLQ